MCMPGCIENAWIFYSDQRNWEILKKRIMDSVASWYTCCSGTPQEGDLESEKHCVLSKVPQYFLWVTKRAITELKIGDWK